MSVEKLQTAQAMTQMKKINKNGIHTLISCHTRRQPAHQAKFGVQYPPQGYFDLQLGIKPATFRLLISSL